MLLGLISSLVFRAVRDALRGNPVAQERIIGSALTALAIADVRVYHEYLNMYVILLTGSIYASFRSLSQQCRCFMITYKKTDPCDFGQCFGNIHWTAFRLAIQHCVLERYHPWKYHIHAVSFLCQVCETS